MGAVAVAAMAAAAAVRPGAVDRSTRLDDANGQPVAARVLHLAVLAGHPSVAVRHGLAVVLVVALRCGGPDGVPHRGALLLLVAIVEGDRTWAFCLVAARVAVVVNGACRGLALDAVCTRLEGVASGALHRGAPRRVVAAVATGALVALGIARLPWKHSPEQGQWAARHPTPDAGRVGLRVRARLADEAIAVGGPARTHPRCLVRSPNQGHDGWAPCGVVLALIRVLHVVAHALARGVRVVPQADRPLLLVGVGREPALVRGATRLVPPRGRDVGPHALDLV
mmetsp:Transcript_63055/g.187928  ORF Transcript_63055/g.187928 Transcript_63055/m.187928 type:complete len:282 (+) Transcript_63055:232-1077(+)